MQTARRLLAPLRSAKRAVSSARALRNAAPPWEPLPTPTLDAAVRCNICGWAGSAFLEPSYAEGNQCPRCGSIARDRFLHWCLRETSGVRPGLSVLETSPRLGTGYRRAMSRWFSYTTSDFDQSAHKGQLRLDLQAIDLESDSLDLVLSAHVLEHVPSTRRALAELRRVLVPGGCLLLQVPLLQGRTAPPVEPEFHGDDTPVFWRFGWDLTDLLADAGFTVRTLCTSALVDAVQRRWDDWDRPAFGGFDVPSILAGVGDTELTAVADDTMSRTFGFEPAYQFVTWECRLV